MATAVNRLGINFFPSEIAFSVSWWFPLSSHFD